MTEKITAWSFSRYNLYQQCPGKAKLMYIDKLKEPTSDAMLNGTKKHKELEDWLKGHAPLPSWMHPSLMEFCTRLLALKPAAELEVAFNKNWQPVDWFAKDAWARIKIDALARTGTHVEILDWKTGKVREGTYDEQLELYALTAMLMFPTAETFNTTLVFVDHGKTIQGDQFVKADKDMLLKRWMDRVDIMLNDTEFRYTPNQYCRNCWFRRANGTNTCDAA